MLALQNGVLFSTEGSQRGGGWGGGGGRGRGHQGGQKRDEERKRWGGGSFKITSHLFLPGLIVGKHMRQWGLGWRYNNY